MSINDALYPYDPTGAAASNRIISESVDIYDTGSASKAMFAILKAAPFFVDTLVIKNTTGTGGVTLIEGVDYIVTHPFHAATDALSRRISGSILFLNKTYIGRVYVTYQSLGGDYTLDDVRIAEELTRDLYTIRTVAWDQLQIQITGFPPYGHNHVASNLIGLSELVDSSDRIAAAIEDSNSGGNGQTGGGGNAALAAHMSATSNAHTKGAVGLANVENYGVANMNDVANAVPNKYITPTILRQALVTYSADLTSIESKLTLLEGLEQTFEDYRITLNGQILAVNNALSTVNTSLSDFETTIVAITTSLNNTNIQVEDQGERLTVAETKVATLNASNTALSESVSSLALTDQLRGEAVGVLEEDVSVLKGLVGVGLTLADNKLKPGASNGFDVDNTTDRSDILRVMGNYGEELNNPVLGPYLGLTYVDYSSGDNSVSLVSGVDKFLPFRYIQNGTMSSNLEFDLFNIDPNSLTTTGNAIKFKYTGLHQLTTTLNFSGLMKNHSVQELDLSISIVESDDSDTPTIKEYSVPCAYSVGKLSTMNKVYAAPRDMVNDLTSYLLNPTTFDPAFINKDIAKIDASIVAGTLFANNAHPLLVNPNGDTYNVAGANNRVVSFVAPAAGVYYIKIKSGYKASACSMVKLSDSTIDFDTPFVYGSGDYGGDLILHITDTGLSSYNVSLQLAITKTSVGNEDISELSAIEVYQIKPDLPGFITYDLYDFIFNSTGFIHTFKPGYIYGIKFSLYGEQNFSTPVLLESCNLSFNTDISTRVRELSKAIRVGD